MSDHALTIKVPETLQRSAVAEFIGEGEEKQVRFSISSDVPYLRYDYWNDKEYYEVLDHSPGGFVDSRLKAGLPMLYNHNRSNHLGRARKYACDGKRLCVEDVVWSTTEDAQQKKRDMEAGVLVDTSVGYSIIGEGKCIGEKDGIPVYQFRWEPHEYSLVTIPADVTVGAGRERQKPNCEPFTITIKNSVDASNNLNDKPNQPTKAMPEANEPVETPANKIDVVNERQNAVKEFRERCKKINDFAESLGNHPEWQESVRGIAAKHTSGEADWSSFHEEALRAHPGARSVNTPDPRSIVGASKKERRQFSLAKAIREANSRTGLTGIEKDLIEASANQYHGKDSRQWSGLCIPDDILHANFAEDHDLDSTALRNLSDNVNALRRSLSVSTFASGGALVGTDLLGGSMIDILRNAVLIGQGPLGVTELGGLVGNIAIPKQTGTTTVYWLAEGASVTESSETFAQLVLVPHRMGVYTAYTKQLLAQASISVESFVRSDQALAMAVEEDRVTINGTGLTGEPLGILNTTGVLANVTFSGAATWADMVALEYGLENANVRTGQQAILTSPVTKSYLKQTPKVAASTFPIFLWEKNAGYPTINGVMPGTVNEYPAYATKNVTSNVMIQGVFQNVIKARWAGFDVVVDPYTGAQTETIKVFVNQWLDVGLRYPQSFNATTDAPTAP